MDHELGSVPEGLAASTSTNNNNEIPLDTNEFLKKYGLTGKKDIKWRQGLTYITPSFPHYEEKTPDSVELESPFMFFSKYFTNDLLTRMVEYTNLYAVQKSNVFAPTNIEEMKTFTGIHVMMGNLHYPRIKCYWEPKIGISLIYENMPINRFYKLRTNLHFVNTQEAEENNNDRFWKIRPLYDTIRAQLLSLPIEGHLSVDEQMVPFKGQLNVKQYVKNKPQPWGVKLFALCGSSGQMFDFIIYQGSKTELDNDHLKIFGQGAAVVLKLSQRINEKNCRLYFDNYFSNYNLLQYLRNQQIYSSGTARQNRFKNPPFSSDKDMKKRGRGSCEQVISQDGEVIITKWYDNKPVVMASNYMGIGKSSSCLRWNKNEKQYIEVERPEVITDYNTHMGGVDKLDFLISIHRTFIRSRKWTLRMFTHAIDLACVNAWIEYRKSAAALGMPKKQILDLLHFRAYIAETMILVDKTNTRKRGRPSLTEASPIPKRARIEVRPEKEVRLDNVGHLPVTTEKFHRCKKPECKGKTKFSCCKCKVHLCLDKKKNCFYAYHTV